MENSNQITQSQTQAFVEEMENTYENMRIALETLLRELDGNPKVTANGTLIEIPMAAGYATCYYSLESYTMRFVYQLPPKSEPDVKL